MRHRHSRLRLRHKPAHSAAMQRNLVTSLLLYESIRTTKKRAEVVQPIIDRLIAVAKSRPAHVAIRYINAVVVHKNASRKTMEVLKERYKSRTSGFTRIVPLGSRAGDGAKVVTLALLPGDAKAEAKAKAEKTEKKAKSEKPAKKPSTSSASAQ